MPSDDEILFANEMSILQTLKDYNYIGIRKSIKSNPKRIITVVLYQIQETNQLQLSSSEIHITRQLLNHSFHYYNRI